MLASALLLGLPGAARAQSNETTDAGLTRITVTLPACHPYPFEAKVFESLLSLELRTDGIERVAAGETRARLHVDIPSCGNHVLLVLEDGVTGKTVGRAVDVESLERPARARFLALSAVELLRASWLELVLQPPEANGPLVTAVRKRVTKAIAAAPPSPSAPPPVPPPAAHTDSPPAPATRTNEHLRIFGGAVVRAYPAWQGGLFGVTVGLDLPAGRVWSWRFDAHGLRGEAFDVLGTVKLWQASAGAAVLAGTAEGPLRLHVGPRFEIGAGVVEGDTKAMNVRTSSGGGLTAAGGAVALLSGKVAKTLHAFGSVEAGFTLAGVTSTADGRKVGGLAGPFGEATIGLSWQP